MNITPEHIASKKQIGTLNGKPVFQVKTTGGLILIVSDSKVLGVAPHQGVARYIAEKKQPDLKLTELSKSEVLPYDSFAFLLPKYEALTEEFIKVQENREK